jgi:hypothetical protein
MKEDLIGIEFFDGDISVLFRDRFIHLVYDLLFHTAQITWNRP